MIIDGEQCLVICVVVALMGDTPALKSMVGLSPSVSSTCYVNMPCMLCEVVMDDLIKLSPRCQHRSLQTLHNFLRSNDRHAGEPDSAWLREVMKSFGYLRIPVVIELHNVPSPESLCLDTMHAIYKGVLVKHFIMLVKLLTGSSKDIRSQQWRRHVWGTISREFYSYCRRNKIAAFCNFHSAKQFKLRMTAGSMREFAKISASILRKIGLVNSAVSTITSQKRIRHFNFWCVHATIVYLLERHSLSSVQLDTLSSLIDQLLSYWREEEFPVTINVHYYIHFVEKIKALGPIRLVANNSREHMIQKLKPYYINSNNSKSKEISIYNKYKMGLFFAVLDLMNFGDGCELKHCR